MSDELRTEQLLTAKAVGEILSLSKRQIFSLKSSGRILAPVKIGGSVPGGKQTLRAGLLWDVRNEKLLNQWKGD